MKLLIDMNLSPRWVEALEDAGIAARHWSAVGDGAASDRDVFEWARRHGFIVPPMISTSAASSRLQVAGRPV